MNSSSSPPQSPSQSQSSLTSQKPIVWLLKKGSEKKFRWGHPWVFSNELGQSPKGLPAGALVELRDWSGGFLARGYGHPNSLISFRTLTHDSSVEIDADFLYQRLSAAARVRRLSGVANWSHRLCFAEGDDLPGLVIDRYRLVASHADRSSRGQVFVVQSSTAGMDRLLPGVFEALERLVNEEAGARGLAGARSEASPAPSWEQTSIVLANDSKSRAMEGIPVEPKKVVRQGEGFKPESSFISVQPALDGLEPCVFEVDFAGGQKTGFFLDQRLNVHLAAEIADEIAKQAAAKGETVRVLDLFCYVGQWGTQLANLLTARGAKVEVTLVDASAQALSLAAKNVAAHGGVAKIEKKDILDALASFETKGYDIVICDPPAFVKKKKDLPTGTQAYFKVNREAIRKTRSGGLFVSCSCSGLFDETEFRAMLARVTTTFGGKARWVSRGSHSVDHPQRPEFPQGTYLKSWIGVIE